jgi:hypothetical protein
MKIETIENILNFLKEKENKEIPESWFDSIEKLKLIKELENHPDGTQYKHRGNLNLINTNIKKLPNDLYVVGSLSLFNCKQLTKLPDKLYVGNYLDITQTNITELPNDLHVEGYIDLISCESLKELPSNLYVGKSLKLWGCEQLTELPDNLYVGGYLYIENTPLANKFTDEQIYEMIKLRGGEIIGDIFSDY